jgi:hypothetical protein
MTISNTSIASTDFSRFFNDYIKHTHRLDLLHQVLPWLCQTQPSLRLISVGFSMNISRKNCWSQLKRCVLDIVMEKPAEVSQDDGCVWYSHGTSCWNPSKRWVYYVKHTPLQLTSAGFFMIVKHTILQLTSADFSMTISNIPITTTDFSRFFHDYVI